LAAAACLGAAGAVRAGAAGEAPGTTNAGLLDSLLDRAATTVPGTYVVTAGGLVPAPAAAPVVVQADAFRGPGRSIRVAAMLGGDLPRPTDVRLRIVDGAASTTGRPRVAAEATASGQVGRVRLIREFALAAGEYEIQAAIGQPAPGGGVVATLARSRLAIPDLWGGPLAVTPVVLADTVATAARSAEASALRFGPTALTPATSDAFARTGEIHVAFRVFNWKAEPGEKPDLTANYAFYEQAERRLVFFNKVKPQRLDGATLGQAFDPADGAVTAGLTVPLQAFPYGAFQLNVRVTDNRSRQSAERQVRFTVVP
jgi:hypothetical protein